MDNNLEKNGVRKVGSLAVEVTFQWANEQKKESLLFTATNWQYGCAHKYCMGCEEMNMFDHAMAFVGMCRASSKVHDVNFQLLDLEGCASEWLEENRTSLDTIERLETFIPSTQKDLKEKTKTFCFEYSSNPEEERRQRRRDTEFAFRHPTALEQEQSNVPF